MSTNGLTIINTFSGSTVYIVSAINGNSSASPTNMNWNQINMSNTNISSHELTYDSSSPLNPTMNNSINVSTGGNTVTYIYAWINRGNPSSNTTILSDVVTAFNNNGLMVSNGSTSTTTIPTGAIIQYTGKVNNNNNIYYVYNKSALTVQNNTSSTVQIRTEANSTNTINNRSSSGACPTSITFPSTTTSSSTNSAVQSINVRSSSTIVSAFPNMPNGAEYTLFEVWKGSNVSSGTTVNYVLLFRPVDFMSFQDCISSSPSINASWNQSTMTITLTDGSNDNGKASNGQPCTVNSDCSSSICGSNGTCQAPSNTGGGFPWWGWLIIAIIVIIIIGIIIFALTRSKNKKKSTEGDMENET